MSEVGFVTMGKVDKAHPPGEVKPIGIGMLGYAFMGKAHSNAYKTLAYMTWPPPLRPELVSIAGRNEDPDRWICGQLYGWFSEERLAQELVLGVGGVRALRALGIDVDVYHFNEGHAVFAGLELVREGIVAGKSFEDAWNDARDHIVFTTHTPVPAGNESHDHGVMKEMGAWLDFSHEQLVRIDGALRELFAHTHVIAVMHPQPYPLGDLVVHDLVAAVIGSNDDLAGAVALLDPHRAAGMEVGHQGQQPDDLGLRGVGRRRCHAAPPSTTARSRRTTASRSAGGDSTYTSEP